MSICAYSFHTTPDPCWWNWEVWGCKGDIMLSGASVRLNLDYYPLLPEKMCLFVIRIPFNSEFPALTISRIFCSFK